MSEKENKSNPASSNKPSPSKETKGTAKKVPESQSSSANTSSAKSTTANTSASANAASTTKANTSASANAQSNKANTSATSSTANLSSNASTASSAAKTNTASLSSQTKTSASAGGQSASNHSATESTAGKSSTASKSAGNSGTTPPPANKSGKKGNGIAWLALILGIVGTAIGSYSYKIAQQPSKSIAAITSTQQQAQGDIANLDKTVNALASHVANNAQGLDKAAVSEMIAQGLQDFAKNTVTQSDLEALKSSAPSQTAGGLSKADVEAMINQAVANINSDHPSIDVSSQLQAIAEAEQSAKAAIAQLDARAQTLERPAAVPNINAFTTVLSAAQVAMDNGQYALAAKHLENAQSQLPVWHLDGAKFANVESALQSATQQLSTLAENDTAARLNALTLTVNHWPFKSGNATAVGTDSNSAADSSMSSKLSAAGKNILSRAFTITKDDTAGLTWINANQSLKNMIRENIRLDMAYLRNAAATQDAAVMQSTTAELTEAINRYFDTSNSDVQAALSTLSSLRVATPALPDLSAIANAANQAIKE